MSRRRQKGICGGMFGACDPRRGDEGDEARECFPDPERQPAGGQRGVNPNHPYGNRQGQPQSHQPGSFAYQNPHYFEHQSFQGYGGNAPMGAAQQQQQQAMAMQQQAMAVQQQQAMQGQPMDAAQQQQVPYEVWQAMARQQQQAVMQQQQAMQGQPMDAMQQQQQQQAVAMQQQQQAVMMQQQAMQSPSYAGNSQMAAMNVGGVVMQSPSAGGVAAGIMQSPYSGGFGYGGYGGYSTDAYSQYMMQPQATAASPPQVAYAQPVSSPQVAYGGSAGSGAYGGYVYKPSYGMSLAPTQMPGMMQGQMQGMTLPPGQMLQPGDRPMTPRAMTAPQQVMTLPQQVLPMATASAGRTVVLGQDALQETYTTIPMISGATVAATNSAGLYAGMTSPAYGNRDGITDNLQRPVMPLPTQGGMAAMPAYSATTAPAYAALTPMGPMTGQSFVVGQEWNREGIPELIPNQQYGGVPPMAAADVGGVTFVGQDRNMDGIPDGLQQPSYGASMPPPTPTPASAYGGGFQTDTWARSLGF